MKKIILMMFMGVALTSVAQPRCICPAQKDSAMCLNLSEKDQKAYDELYESYTQKAKAVREKYGCDRMQKGVKPTDEQMDKMHRNRLASRKAMADLQEEYYGKFRKILTPAQAAKVLKLNHRNAGRHQAAAGRGGRKHCGQQKNFCNKGRCRVS